MPATDVYWRNIKKVHVIFALSTVALFGTTIWMMAADHREEWHDHQRTMERIRALKLSRDIEAKKSENAGEIERLESELGQARADLAARESELAPLRDDLKQAELAVNLKEQDLRAQRAIRDKARADYDLAVRDDLSPSRQQALLDIYDREQQTVDELTLDVQELEAARNRVRAELDEEEERVKELEAALAQTRLEVELLHKSLVRIEPESRFSRIKRKVMEWPIIDGFNSHLAIQQDWLPDLPIKLGMASTARFDRCRTCHVGIDQVEADERTGGLLAAFPHGEPSDAKVETWVAESKYPHPYATHPNPDLYLTASSPHPVTTFGCTTCHDGNGSGTSFQNGEHTPNDPREALAWKKEYGHAPNHFWEYPMQPARFTESSCIKCHHQVEELGVHPEFGATAPKVHAGFKLMEKYGCFGCHETHGFEGGKAIGPDLRLEPNYASAAEQLLHGLQSESLARNGKEADDGNGEKEPPQSASGVSIAELRELARAIVRRPDESSSERKKLADLLGADKEARQDARTELAKQKGLSPSDRRTALDDLNAKFLPLAAHNLGDSFQDESHPGKYRKVGPSLRHIQAKSSKDWIAYWTEEPKRFRPDTRMPQFFHLTNQDDPHAQALMPAELAAVAQYLHDKSQPIELLSPKDDYKPDPKRGKLLFAQKGCVACHKHEKIPGSFDDFGPDLSRVHEKVRLDSKQGDQPFSRWLYTWIREPQRYHKRTKMPDLFIDPSGEGEDHADPAADIAAFLLEGGPGEFPAIEPEPYLGVELDENFTQNEAAGLGLESPRGARVTLVMPGSPATRVVLEGRPSPSELRENDVVLTWRGQNVRDARHLESLVAEAPTGSKVELTVWRHGAEQPLTLTSGDPLDDLVRLFLSKVLTNAQVEETLETRKYPLDREQIKGDEIELALAPADGRVDDEEWRRMKLNYLGRRTISRYGCFGCHDILGFEQARPIGTTLQDWGRKDTSRLAPEHIEEFLHHHGEPDGSSTHERVVAAMKRTAAGEFKDETVRERELSAGYFYDSLLHHGRAGFLWQKLRQPRSYDYRKTETKGYDERLRMPKFPFNEEEIEQIATFVLGLVADPPPPQYIYKPEGPALARIEGEKLLQKYNCASCHYVELPKVTYAADLALRPFAEGVKAGEEPFGYDLLKLLRPPRKVDTSVARKGTNIFGNEDADLTVINFHGLQVLAPDEDPLAEGNSFYSNWEHLDVDGKLIPPGGTPLQVSENSVVDVTPGRGGEFAEWLFKGLKQGRSGLDGLRLPGRVDQNKSNFARQMVPPPLYEEGIKVQTPWLFRFLKNPEKLRHTTVLRMPRFNMSDAEARSLANYFAAVDGAEYPYQDVPQRQPEYLLEMNDLVPQTSQEHPDYLSQSWKLLTNQRLCLSCHSVGGNQVQVSDPEKDIRGPDLEFTADRLRPDWTLLWIAKPEWITPYTSMPALFSENEKKFTESFDGEGRVQVRAVRDALMNYHRLMEQHRHTEFEYPSADPADTKTGDESQ